MLCDGRAVTRSPSCGLPCLRYGGSVGYSNSAGNTVIRKQSVFYKRVSEQQKAVVNSACVSCGTQAVRYTGKRTLR